MSLSGPAFPRRTDPKRESFRIWFLRQKSARCPRSMDMRAFTMVSLRYYSFTSGKQNLPLMFRLSRLYGRPFPSQPHSPSARFMHAS